RGGGRFGGRIAENIAASPHRLDVILAFGGDRELFAQLADEDVDDLQLRLVHAAIEMVEEHLLGEGRALAQAQQFENAVFLAGEMEWRVFHFDGAAVEIDGELAGTDYRLGMALGAAHDRLDAGDQLTPVEGFRQEIVGAEAQTLDLVVEFGKAGEDEDRRAHARGTQPAQHLIAIDIRQHQVEDDDVVIVEFADFQPVFAEIRRVADKSFGAQHHLNAGGGCRIIFHEQYAHLPPPQEPPSLGTITRFNYPYQLRLMPG